MSISRNCFLFSFLFCFCWFSCKPPVPVSGNKSNPDSSSQTLNPENSPESDSLAIRYGFKDLKTDFSKHSIPLDSIQSGGPSKNGIPAIDFPEFISQQEALGFFSDPDFGILVQGEKEAKFYPFNILNWHEIVNDEIDGKLVAVTFCPLCGSAIVFERIVEGDTLIFGVSGKLYESNLLMFDNKTESLWSQALGEAVVGKYTGKRLELVNSSVTSFEDVKKYFPQATVLSPRTGFDRNYGEHPYADYLATEELYFPVSHTSRDFAAKDIMFIVPYGKSSIAFNWLALYEKGEATIATHDGHVAVKINGSVPYAFETERKKVLPGYFSFWFSWYTLHSHDGIVWNKE